MNELYAALGRFVVRFSLVGATMVQAMVLPDEQRSKERALKFIDMDFSKLIGQWHKMRIEDACARATDRRALTVIKNEATRLLRFRNRSMHDWWAGHLGAKGGLMLYSLKTGSSVTWPTVELIASHTQQAALMGLRSRLSPRLSGSCSCLVELIRGALGVPSVQRYNSRRHPRPRRFAAQSQ
jgi:hypothetical protein